jgi:nucleoprotein TPR
LKRWERDQSIANKEIDDLQKQVAVLLKECQDIQLRCGSRVPIVGHGAASISISNPISNSENSSDEHMTFNDINGLVQQNVQLRNKVHMLSTDLEKKDIELRETFQIELKKITDAAASRVEKVMKKSEEQAIMIESLHRSVAMYRKLCEEQQKTRSNIENISDNLQDDGGKDLMVLFEGSQEVSKKTYEQVSERARKLDEELTKLRLSLSLSHDRAPLFGSCEQGVLHRRAPLRRGDSKPEIYFRTYGRDQRAVVCVRNHEGTHLGHLGCVSRMTAR